MEKANVKEFLEKLKKEENFRKSVKEFAKAHPEEITNDVQAVKYMAKEKGMDISDTEIREAFSEIYELDESELENVSGGDYSWYSGTDKNMNGKIDPEEVTDHGCSSISWCFGDISECVFDVM